MTMDGGASTIDCELVADGLPHPRRLSLRLAEGATVADAMRAACAAWGEAMPDAGQFHVGVWGLEARLEQPVRDGDRVEWYCALPNDPRSARRARAARPRGGG